MKAVFLPFFTKGTMKPVKPRKFANSLREKQAFVHRIVSVTKNLRSRQYRNNMVIYWWY